MIEETLRAHAQVVNDMASTHDTADFLRRLAMRVSQDASSPHRPHRQVPTAVDDAADTSGGSGSGNVVDSWALPAPGAPGAPPSHRHPPYQHTRPALRRLRRRPTPMIPPNPALRPPAVLDHVRRLCETVVGADDAGELLEQFDADYDEVGARAFACLLYLLGRRDGALYWWGFAAGAGDPLAAHLLAAHHAAEGPWAAARVWRTYASWLGFRVDRHVPHPISATVRSEHGLARRVPHGEVVQEFMGLDRLPEVLVQH